MAVFPQDDEELGEPEIIVGIVRDLRLQPLQEVLQEMPDCVFLDIVMPEVGGIEALQVIKEVSPEIPVVMLSSAGSPQKLMTTLKMGAMEFIQKPYKSEQIQKVVETIRKKVGLDG